MLQQVSSFLLKVFGWRIMGDYPHKFKKCIIVVGPHTSNFDFPIGMLVRFSTKSSATFIGKKSLFTSPLGFLFKWMGGIPVDRRGGKNFVASVVNMFRRREKLQIVISPEGTRKRVEQLKTGFYHIAKGANIPIIPALFDWENKRLIFSDPIFPKEDIAAVINELINLFNSVQGYHPAKGRL